MRRVKMSCIVSAGCSFRSLPSPILCAIDYPRAICEEWYYGIWVSRGAANVKRQARPDMSIAPCLSASVCAICDCRPTAALGLHTHYTHRCRPDRTTWPDALSVWQRGGLSNAESRRRQWTSRYQSDLSDVRSLLWRRSRCPGMF